VGREHTHTQTHTPSLFIGAAVLQGFSVSLLLGGFFGAAVAGFLGGNVVAGWVFWCRGQEAVNIFPDSHV